MGASKAAPVTEVARESISVAKNVPPSNIASSSTSHLDDLPKHNRHPSLRLTRKEGASSRSLPANATTTRINIASDGSAYDPAVNPPPEPDDTAKDNEQLADKSETVVDESTKDQTDTVAETTAPNESSISAETDNKPESTEQTGGWFSWLYRSAPVGKDTSSDSAPPAASTEPPTEDQTLKEDTTKADSQAPEDQGNTKTDTLETTEIPVTSQKLSWFQMWYGSSSSKGPEEPKKEQRPANEQEPSNEYPQTADAEPTHDAPPTPAAPSETPPKTNDSPKAPGPNPRSSAWSFWFRDNSQDSTQVKTQDVQSVEASVKENPASKQSNLEQKPEHEQEVEVKKKGGAKLPPLKDSTGPGVVPDRVAAQLEMSTNALPPKAPEATASKNLQKVLSNQVLPRFHDTFPLQESPSILQTIGRFLHYNKEQDTKHVYRIRDPHRIRKALAIGIHGYFPAPLIRSVLGQPTGTSVRFSNMAASAIRKWTESRGYTCDVEKIALEGEGRISERVDLLWKLLLNWMEEIRNADYIMVACHSQGVPVAIMLVAKLIAFGCLNASRVGVCAMAGVNLGPFPDYRSRWISGSAGELFDFALPYSQVSKDYEAALRCALDFGVRISYIGSIDDQLVSLEVITPSFSFNHKLMCLTYSISSHHSTHQWPTHIFIERFLSMVGFMLLACAYQ